jgi:hypothetical protein
MVRCEFVAVFKLFAKFLEIVYFTVENNGYCPVFVKDRLMAAGNIYNGKPAHPKAGFMRMRYIYAFIIRPPVPHHIAHTLKLLGFNARR